MCAEVCYSKSKPCFYGFPTFNVFDSSALLHAAGKLNENNIFFIVVTKMFMFSTRICEIQLYITKWHLQGFLLFFYWFVPKFGTLGLFLYFNYPVLLFPNYRSWFNSFWDIYVWILLQISTCEKNIWLSKTYLINEAKFPQHSISKSRL